MARQLRWQLYDQAIPKGLPRRSGGYSVVALRKFLKILPPRPEFPPPDFDPLFSPLGLFIEVIDYYEQENDKRSLIKIRQNLKRRARTSSRIGQVSEIIRDLDKRDISLSRIRPKKRGSKDWQTRKSEFKSRKGLSQSEWREYRRNKLNAQRS